MALHPKYEFKHKDILRDTRPWGVRFVDGAKEPAIATMSFAIAGVVVLTSSLLLPFADLIFFVMCGYCYFLFTRSVPLPFKMPKSANAIDPKYRRPDGSFGKADGILYMGNDPDTGREVWFTNTDARTHCLYLGTTGSGKTFGLKSFSTNALCWGSGYIYIDGKADTDLWSTLSAQARRFGRDDDLLVMNYMTGGIGGRVPSNTLNPFSSGSSSYLTNMLVSLMPEAEGDNVMWKDRAVALISAIMPCLVWKRDNQNMPLNIGVVRRHLIFKEVIRLARDSQIPERLRGSLKGYLNELPGYVDSVFDDEGNEKPARDGSMPDTSTPRQQHGYLSMQFTRSLSSLGDDYGFIFDTPAADVDMLDVVLNRRILIVLIPALEKSNEETANLGKIIASTLKGMMGQTLGSTVEGDTATVIENKVTTSSTPFMAIFDEVGYYAAQGMAVMAAQARSLGFSLIFAAQDMPALEKRVKVEARSITANCNIKIFGKLEDPTQTREFFEKAVGQSIVTEVSGFERNRESVMAGINYMGSTQASVQIRNRASYEALKSFPEGRAVCVFSGNVCDVQIYNSDIGHARAMRVHRMLAIPPPSEEALAGLRQVNDVVRRLRSPSWNPQLPALPPQKDIAALADGFALGREGQAPLLDCATAAVAALAQAQGQLKREDALAAAAALPTPEETAPPVASAKPAAPVVRPEEKDAAEAVARVGGPLSWGQLIGAEEPAVAAAPPPVPETETPGTAEKPSPGNPLSWGDIIGAGPAVSKPAEKEPAASATENKEPGTLNWGEIIGAADDGKGGG